MKTLVEESSYFEFLLSGSDILVLVESTVDEVIIRTSRGGLGQFHFGAFFTMVSSAGLRPQGADTNSAISNSIQHWQRGEIFRIW